MFLLQFAFFHQGSCQQSTFCCFQNQFIHKYPYFCFWREITNKIRDKRMFLLQFAFLLHFCHTNVIFKLIG